MHYFISGCDDKGIEKIKKVEKENDLLLIAYRESDYEYKELSQEELKKIAQLEEELGVRIIALKKS
ncbi:hypothetical protein PM10SUCC1_03700 [Propionigenium maris DSM 9537]|uniref:Uncharacterized protein n=1 Tax=Propionigenium maris DSM 9537 TaxID=1123000 RepID=A0A9W6GJ07_9FUSO|nr:hypothetical protein [Propionigenium maris]GLI54855.1 hypothetical protein PM10SUCC1_03700 [Propionigenium maris DSM 9537]